MKRNLTFLIMGILFLLVGVGYVGNELLGWNFSLFFDGWWTLFLIVPSFISIVSNKSIGFSLGVFIFGILLLLSETGFIPQNINFWSMLVPLIIIYIGVTLIIKYFTSHNKKNHNQYYYNPQQNYQADYANQYTSSQQNENKSYAYTDTDSMPSYNAILSGNDVKNTSTDFRGARISAILGGCDIDFSQSIVLQDCTVYCTAILGGIEIRAPKNVKIVLEKTSILGGTECTAFCIPPEGEGPTVKFIATSILGGIEIK